MTENNAVGAVDFLHDELAEIDQRLVDLLKERERVANYLKKLTGTEPPPFDRAMSTSTPATAVRTEPGRSVRPVSPLEDSPTTLSGSERVYHSRQFNKRLVGEAIEIILANGRPMSTPEIMRTHTMRDEVSAEALYRLMYNRVVVGTLMSLDGAFWPEGKPLPNGWSLESARRSSSLKAAPKTPSAS